MKEKNCLIYCNCGAGIISTKKQTLIADYLKTLNIDVIELHDICAFSVNEKPFLNNLNEKYHKKFIVACYPRAIENIFLQNNITLSNYEVINFRELGEDTLAKNIGEKVIENSDEATYTIEKSSLEVPAWYPVIDKERCTLCGQCARFCVFGVYKFNKKSLEVVNPLSCKNNCPACGRTCPASAIIFPRLPENSVLSGAQPGEDPKPIQAVKNDGLFTLLNERNSMRRNIFRSGVMEQAEAEKRNAIEELKKGLKKNS